MSLGLKACFVRLGAVDVLARSVLAVLLGAKGVLDELSIVLIVVVLGILLR